MGNKVNGSRRIGVWRCMGWNIEPYKERVKNVPRSVKRCVCEDGGTLSPIKRE
jgi:hypothetical protein